MKRRNISEFCFLLNFSLCFRWVCCQLTITSLLAEFCLFTAQMICSRLYYKKSHFWDFTAIYDLFTIILKMSKNYLRNLKNKIMWFSKIDFNLVMFMDINVQSIKSVNTTYSKWRVWLNSLIITLFVSKSPYYDFCTQIKKCNSVVKDIIVLLN